MKRIVSILMVIVCTSVTVFAQKGSQNSPGTGGIGLQSSYYSNYIRIGYSRNAQHGIPTFGVRSIDAFHLVEWEAQFELNNRFRGRISIPFERNIRKNVFEVRSFNGLSDIKLTGIFDVFKKSTNEGLQAMGSFGLGVTAPTGEYRSEIHRAGYPDQFNLGMGTWIIHLEPSVQLSSQNAGVILQANYIKALETAAGYRYGDEWDLVLTSFYVLDLKKGWAFIPLGGLKYEHSSPDQYVLENSLTRSGGLTQALLETGLTIRYTRWSLATRVFIPLSGEYPEAVRAPGNQVSVQLFYSI